MRLRAAKKKTKDYFQVLNLNKIVLSFVIKLCNLGLYREINIIKHDNKKKKENNIGIITSINERTPSKRKKKREI